MTKFGTRLSGALYVLLLLGLVIVGLGLLVSAVIALMAFLRPDQLTGALSVGAQELSLRQPALGLVLAATIAALCLYAGAVLVQMLGLLRSAAKATPFTEANVRRLRILAALFGVALVVQLAGFLLPSVVQDVMNLREGAFDLDMLLSALFALVLAEVFREGVRLREDAEGTI